MDNDDQQVGVILNRRDVLAVLGGVGAALLAGCSPAQQTSFATTASSTSSVPDTATAFATMSEEVVSGTLPACVVRPELTEGPYFVDEKLNRSDIRSDPSDGLVKEGTPFQLLFAVSQIGNNTCTPLDGATVDVWHCDALGVYSDVQDPGFNTRGSKFLRGYQTTDANGMAEFLTIYPGWYRGRTVHIHFKIRTADGYDFTSQLFFDDAFSDQIFTQEPYAIKGDRGTRNNNDGIYQQNGSQLTLSPTAEGDGYTATFDIGLQLS